MVNVIVACYHYYHCYYFYFISGFSPSTVMLLAEGNWSTGATFTLLGFLEYPHLQIPLFLVFLTIYTVTVVGNLA